MPSQNFIDQSDVDIVEDGLTVLALTAQHPDMHDTYETLVLRGDEEKLHSFLNIVVDSDQISLRGSGGNVEPAVLSGHVVLQLVEPTSIKEITLHFRGKARMPASNHDTATMGTSGAAYLVCYHDWSFLEGPKKHSHTLKAGRHIFPFQLRVGGALPSSISTSVLGGASIHYKLRALASRPGLSHNFQDVKPIYIVRSFIPTALEYQQSLEIENTWPGKLMYSIVLPHKAWAAGDSLTALAKFSPLAKGGKVVSISTSIIESSKMTLRTGFQEINRTLFTSHHSFIDGKAVPTDDSHHHKHRTLSHLHSHGSSHINRTSQSTPSSPLSQTNNVLGHSSRGSFSSVSSSPTADFPSWASPESGSADVEPSSSHTPDGAQTEPTDTNEDIVTTIRIDIPESVTPSHANDPIVLSHRIRWNILIANLDGHKSELRCSLPLHILDNRVLREARASTALTRRLLFGCLEGPPEQEEVDTQLPSYPSHVRDRVPNFDYVRPDSAQLTATTDAQTSSPAVVPVRDDHLPPVPGDGSLAWVNSELLRQQSASAGDRQARNSFVGSRHGSRFTSRLSSRAESPDSRNTDSAPSSASVNSTNQTYVHSSSSCRNLHNIFQISLKPLVSLSSSFSLSSRNSSRPQSSSGISPSLSHSDSVSLPNGFHHDSTGTDSPDQPGSPASTRTSRLLTEVPDYEVASRGFAGGGVTPLSSLRGLPSYEEASSASATPVDVSELT